MRLVLAALCRPITVVVALIAIALCAVLALKRMPVDIFPQVGDPAIYVAQPYGGMDPAQMEGYLTYYYEYHFLYITGIDHVESKSIQGAALMKLVFHEGTDMSQAMARDRRLRESRARLHAARNRAAVHHALRRRQRRRRPAGLQQRQPARRAKCRISRSTACARCSPRCPASPRRRPSAATSAPSSSRSIPTSSSSTGISPDEAIAAVSKASLVMPSGNMWTGKIERIARTNAALGGNLPELLSTPIRPGSGTTVYLRDIGTIENGTDLVTAYAHVNGNRTVYIPVTKRADASTLSVINAVKAAIPDFKKAVPDDIDVRLEFDQSPYVTQFHPRSGDRRSARRGAHRPDGADLSARLAQRADRRPQHSVRAAGAVILLWATGQTINIMTLGGLALAVGVLVDEATVEIENIHTQMLPGVSRARAVVEACSRTAMARLLSMFCILAVFVPSFFMVGVGRQLFVPLSLAVAFSMIASYLLSSTLVPVFSTWLMKEAHRGEATEGLFGHLRAILRRLSWRHPAFPLAARRWSISRHRPPCCRS